MDSEQIRSRIDSKKAHIRYLENRIHDHTPILAEIKRREEEIAKHQATILKLRETLADLPSALTRAKEELRALENRLRAVNGRSVLTADELKNRIAALQAKIAQMKGQL